MWPPKDIPNVVMMSLYDEYLNICDLKCEVLNTCLDEQIQCRILRGLPVTDGPENAPPPVADLDCSDLNVLTVAKDLFNIWVVSMEKLCPWLTVLGAKLMSMHGYKKKRQRNPIS